MIFLKSHLNSRVLTLLNLHLFYFFMLFPFEVHANVEFTYYLDHQQNMGLQFKVVRVPNGKQKLIIDYAEYLKTPPTDESQKTINYLKSRIGLQFRGETIGGNKIPLEIEMSLEDDFDKNVVVQMVVPPHHQATLTTFQLPVLPKISDLDDKEAQPPQFSPGRKIGTALLRYIGQLSDDEARDGELLDWINLDANDETERQNLHSNMDLHTHFGGAMRSESILEVADDHNIPYPINLLLKMGLSWCKLIMATTAISL